MAPLAVHICHQHDRSGALRLFRTESASLPIIVQKRLLLSALVMSNVYDEHNFVAAQNHSHRARTTYVIFTDGTHRPPSQKSYSRSLNLRQFTGKFKYPSLGQN